MNKELCKIYMKKKWKDRIFPPLRDKIKRCNSLLGVDKNTDQHFSLHTKKVKVRSTLRMSLA